MKNGKEGAEILSGIINKIFTPSINIIYKNNGFISIFGGDSFYAIFNENQSSLFASKKIGELFEKERKQYTKFGLFEIFVKIGISYGNINWRIIKNNIINSYYFKGQAIGNSSECEKYCEKGEIIFDNSILEKINSKLLHQIKYKKKMNTFYSLKILPKNKINVKNFIKNDLKIQKKFFSENILKLRTKGEFREGVSCFIFFHISSP